MSPTLELDNVCVSVTTGAATPWLIEQPAALHVRHPLAGPTLLVCGACMARGWAVLPADWRQRDGICGGRPSMRREDRAEELSN